MSSAVRHLEKASMFRLLSHEAKLSGVAGHQRLIAVGAGMKLEPTGSIVNPAGNFDS